MYDTVIAPQFIESRPLQHFAAEAFPYLSPVHWLKSHFAVGGWSPLQRLIFPKLPLLLTALGFQNNTTVKK